MAISEASKLSARETIELIKRLRKNLATVIRGKEEAIEYVVTTLLGGGHLLIEDVPGVGKTTLAHSVAVSLACSFRRVQFTADMLPSDLIGVSIFNQKEQLFEFRQGPLFSQIVLADEINRTSPRTQSALLEAMNEGQISVDRETHILPKPFLVIATQNPIESYGTYPLPESQLDRFLMRIRLGYPSPEVEKEVLKTRTHLDPVLAMKSVLDAEQILQMQASVDPVRLDDSLLDYLHAIVMQTRESSFLSIGVSTRGALLFVRAVKAYALVKERDYVLPDDIKALAIPCLAHRIVLRQRVAGDSWSLESQQDTSAIIDDILQRLPVPL